MAFAPPVPPAAGTSYRRPSIRQRRPFSRKPQLRPLSHPHPHPLRHSGVPEGAAPYNYHRMTVASAEQLQAQMSQSSGSQSHRRRPSVLRRSKPPSPRARPGTYHASTAQQEFHAQTQTFSNAQSPCLHTVTSGVVLNDIPPPSSVGGASSSAAAEASATTTTTKKRERRRTLSKVRSLIVNLVQRRPSVETYQEEPPINLDSPHSFGAPLRPHRSPDAESFIVSSKIVTDMTELKPTRSSSPQRLSVQSGHSIVGGILPSLRRRSLLRERLVSHFSTDTSDDETEDESDAEAALDPTQNRGSNRGSRGTSHRGSRLRDIKMEDARASSGLMSKTPQKETPPTSVIFGRRFSLPVNMTRIKSMPEMVRHPLRHLSFQPRGHSLDRIAF